MAVEETWLPWEDYPINQSSWYYYYYPGGDEHLLPNLTIFDDDYNYFDRLERERSALETFVAYFVPCMVTLGLAGNLSTLAVVLLSRQLRLSTRGVIVTTMAVVDVLSLILRLLRSEPLLRIDISGESDAACKLTVYGLHVVEVSNLLAVFIAVDVMLSVLYPRNWKTTSRRAIIITLIITVLTIGIVVIYSTHVAALFHLATINTGYPQPLHLCHIPHHQFHASYRWFVADVVFLNLLPCVALLLLSAVLVFIVRWSKKKVVTQQGAVFYCKGGDQVLIGAAEMETLEEKNPHGGARPPSDTVNPPGSYDTIALPLGLTALVFLATGPYTGLQFTSIYYHNHILPLDRIHHFERAYRIIPNLYALVLVLKFPLYVLAWAAFRRVCHWVTHCRCFGLSGYSIAHPEPCTILYNQLDE